MRKKAYLLIAVELISLVLSACGSSNSKQDREAKEAAERIVEGAVDEAKTELENKVAEEKEEIKEKKEEIKEGIKEEIKEVENSLFSSIYMKQADELNSTGQADLFSLVDVDGDNIPELAAISSEGAWDKDQVFLYTTDGSEIITLASDIAPGMEGHFIAFFEGKNIFVQSGASSGERFIFSKIEDSRPVEIMSVDSFEMVDENGNSKVICHINDKEVTEAEYITAIRDCIQSAGNMIKLAGTSGTEMSEESVNLDEGSFITNEVGKRAYSTYDEIKEELSDK